MAAKHGRTTEQEIGQAVLKYLSGIPGGEATIAEIKKHLGKHFPFNPADREQSDTRVNEEMWEQQVRNLVSHRTAEDNVINDGLLAYRPRRLAITDAGKTFVKRKYG
jgi:uncharacterized membrane protein